MPINLPNYERQTDILEKTNAIKTAIDNDTIGKKKRTKTFTSNGTWQAPEGVTKVFVTGGGAGGSGAAQSTVGSLPGKAGGVTSFGSLLTLFGGSGGKLTPIPPLPGGPGGQCGGVFFGAASDQIFSSCNGNSGPYFGGCSITNAAGYKAGDGGYCSGGGCITQTGFASSGAGGDFVYNKQLEVVPGSNYIITIGVGGESSAVSTSISGKGGDGILTIEWWE